MNYVEETMPYKKKATKTSPPKADHKHKFVDCIFEYECKDGRLDRERGFVPVHKTVFGRYCPICGKINHSSNTKWQHQVKSPWASGFFSWAIQYTEEAERELDPKTRTLPTFDVDDYFSQKYVAL